MKRRGGAVGHPSVGVGAGVDQDVDDVRAPLLEGVAH